MFFKYNLITTSHIETLLEKENVTLRELMDQEDILQECKALSKKLVDFLVRPESLNEMVTLVTEEPDEQLEEKTRYKYSNVSCELLTSDVSTINEALSGSETLLNKLYNFLNNEKPLNPLLASFFSKTISKIFSRKTELIFEYLNAKTDFITLLLNHIETSAIMDLLVRLLTYSETIEMRTKVVEWLNAEKIVQRLVSLIDPAFSEDCHCNAAQALCDMIKASRERMSLLQEKAEADPLLEAIESTEVVTELINHMFSGESKESVFVNGIAVLLTLLEFKKPTNTQVPPTQNQSSIQAENAPQSFASFFFRNEGPEQMTALDAVRLAKGVNNVLEAVMPQIDNFHKLFTSPPTKPPMTLTIGCLDPPLGYTRLELSRFIVALITTNTHGVNVQLASLKTFHTVMELFFKYSWNNFLHTQVEHAINRILTNAPTVDDDGNKVQPLLDELLVTYEITKKILDIFKEHDSDISECKTMENGYMGHLTKIANDIAQNVENGRNSDLIKKKLNELPPEHIDEWEKFTTNTLVEINKKNNSPLVGGVTLPSSSESDDGINFRGISFTQEAALQQAFANYQGTQISTNFVDQYCFNEDFNEAEDSVAGQLNCLAQARFNRKMMGNCSLFEQVCREKSYSINDPDSDEDIWDDKDKSPCFRRRKESDGNSSDSDEDVPPPTEVASASVNDEVKMEIDSQDGWTANFDSVPMEVGSGNAQNPWEISEQPSSTSDVRDSWADFSNFSNFAAAAGESSSEISSTTSISAVAMETVDPAMANGKFVSSSEVSSTSDSTSQLAPHVPVENQLPVVNPVTEGTSCAENVELPPIPLPASGDTSFSKESEAKALTVPENEVANSIASPDPCEECCSSSNTVQNGPV